MTNAVPRSSPYTPCDPGDPVLLPQISPHAGRMQDGGKRRLRPRRTNSDERPLQSGRTGVCCRPVFSLPSATRSTRAPTPRRSHGMFLFLSNRIRLSNIVVSPPCPTAAVQPHPLFKAELPPPPPSPLDPPVHLMPPPFQSLALAIISRNSPYPSKNTPHPASPAYVSAVSMYEN